MHRKYKLIRIYCSSIVTQPRHPTLAKVIDVQKRRAPSKHYVSYRWSALAFLNMRVLSWEGGLPHRLRNPLCSLWEEPLRCSPILTGPIGCTAMASPSTLLPRLSTSKLNSHGIIRVPPPILPPARPPDRPPARVQVYVVDVTWSDGSQLVIYRRYSSFYDLHIGVRIAPVPMPGTDAAVPSLRWSAPDELSRGESGRHALTTTPSEGVAEIALPVI